MHTKFDEHILFGVGQQHDTCHWFVRDVQRSCSTGNHGLWAELCIVIFEQCVDDFAHVLESCPFAVGPGVVLGLGHFYLLLPPLYCMEIAWNGTPHQVLSSTRLSLT